MANTRRRKSVQMPKIEVIQENNEEKTNDTISNINSPAIISRRRRSRRGSSVSVQNIDPLPMKTFAPGLFVQNEQHTGIDPASLLKRKDLELYLDNENEESSFVSRMMEEEIRDIEISDEILEEEVLPKKTGRKNPKMVKNDNAAIISSRKDLISQENDKYFANVLTNDYDRKNSSNQVKNYLLIFSGVVLILGIISFAIIFKFFGNPFEF